VVEDLVVLSVVSSPTPKVFPAAAVATIAAAATSAEATTAAAEAAAVAAAAAAAAVKDPFASFRALEPVPDAAKVAATPAVACQGCFGVNKHEASECETCGNRLRAENDNPQLFLSPSDDEEEFDVLCFPLHPFQLHLHAVAPY
jgi:hypothetical protein